MAMDYEMSLGSRGFKNRPVHSEVVNESQCLAIGSIQDNLATLDYILQFVARQDKRLTNQDQSISELTIAVKELTSQRVHQFNHRPKFQPRYTEGGHPICFRCNEAGYIAKNQSDLYIFFSIRSAGKLQKVSKPLVHCGLGSVRKLSISLKKNSLPLRFWDLLILHAHL